MDFCSDPNNFMDGFFGKIMSTIKRKTNSTEPEISNGSKMQRISKNVSSLNDNNDKPLIVHKETVSSQTDSVVYLDYLDSIVPILSCNVCHDLCQEAFQCKNGHLICSNCSSKISDDWITLCPVCRVNLKESLARSLVTEHLVNELPERCPTCSEIMPRSALNNHQINNCCNRIINCKYSIVGCRWADKFVLLQNHEVNCQYKTMTIEDCYNLLTTTDSKKDNRCAFSLFNTLSDKFKNGTAEVKVNVNLIPLPYLNQNLNETANIYKFENRLFKQGIKIKFCIKLYSETISLSYSLCHHKYIKGYYSFFINKIKLGYREFNLEHKLVSKLFSDQEEWTGWHDVLLLDDSFNEFKLLLADVEGKCIYVNLFMFEEKVNDNSLLKVTAVSNDRWSDLMNDLRRDIRVQTRNLLFRRNRFISEMQDSFNDGVYREGSVSREIDLINGNRPSSQTGEVIRLAEEETGSDAVAPSTEII